tara:strand:+ start:279 stop:1214 length:936 start_codon:yes stop_codon:yes gene_type:complete
MNDILTINDSLKSTLWRNNALDPAVSQKLIEIATKFFDDLGLQGATLDDITFTGSLANYNWTKYSDIDLHLLVDFAKVDDNIELVREFFNAKTSLWNKTHNIEVLDHEVELYVQNIDEDHHSTGVYSIKNDQWIAEPIRIEPKINTDMVKRKIKSFIDMIDRVEDEFDDKSYEKSYEMAVNLARKIKKFRQSGLEEAGEYSNENLTFKYLRNKGHIKTLYDTRNQSYDKMMSLDGNYDKKFKIFVSQDPKLSKKGFDRLQEEEKFQKIIKKRHLRMKKRLISLGGQKNVPPFSKKPNFKRGKSAPSGYGGT